MSRRHALLSVLLASTLAAGLGELEPSALAESLRYSTLHASVVPMGRGTYVNAVGARYAVGSLRVGNGHSHAFAADLRTPDPVVRDLGTLGGASSSAAAVHGSLVAGESKTSDGSWHVFVVDLSATDPHLIDLGSPPGEYVDVAAVSRRLVVGAAERGSDAEGFGLSGLAIADLTAAHPQMTDVGGPLSGQLDVTALDGNVVVGHFWADGRAPAHAFYYDAAAPTPAFVDMGSASGGGGTSWAEDVSGSVIVGETDTAKGSRPFVYDLGADQPKFRLLGARARSAVAIQGSTVVGTLWTGGMYAMYAFDTSTGTMRKLGTLGNGGGQATDLDGSFVVGQAMGLDGSYQAIAYDLARPGAGVVDLGRSGSSDGLVKVAGHHVLTWDHTILAMHYTTKPAFFLSPVRTVVGERTGRVAVKVRRAGDPRVAATVDYRTQNGPAYYGLASPAKAGSDYVSSSGILHFRPGETTKTISVRILNDARDEDAEELLVALRDPGAGAVLGTPQMAEVVIRKSDIEPDLWIGPAPSSEWEYVPRGYLGNDIYNTTGRGQTLVKYAHRGELRRFFLRLYTDQPWCCDSTFTLHAGPAPLGARVRYFHRNRDITAQLRSAAGLRVAVSTGEWDYDSYWPMRIEITPRAHAPTGSQQIGTLRATWRGDSIRTDLVKGLVRVVP